MLKLQTAERNVQLKMANLQTRAKARDYEPARTLLRTS
jgi:hypothetical protein